MSDGESKGRKARPYWLPVIIAFIMWLVLTYFYFTPEAVDRTRFTFDEWKNIGYLVTSIMLVWLFVWKITLNTDVISEAEEEKPKAKTEAKKAEEPEEEEEPPDEEPPKPRKKKRVVVKAPATAAAAAGAAAIDDELPDGLHRPKDIPEEELKDLPRVIEWEKKEPGGVYSDTLIRVDDTMVLNLRTLLGKVCHNCEELDDCKRRVAGKVSDEIFLYNFECKDGLKKELNKARKKREKEKEKAAAAKELVEGKAATAKDDEEKEKAPTKKGPSKKVKKTITSKKKSKGTKSTKKKSTSSSSGSKKKKVEEDK